jgi:hypothetical protein
VYRALRSDLLSIGARFDSFDEAITYARLEFADVPPSVMYPKLQHAPGANNSWLNFQRYREQESSISDGTSFTEVGQPEGHFLDRVVPDGSQGLFHSTRIPHGLAATSRFHEHRELVYMEMEELSRYMMCTAPLPPDPVFITHSPPFPMISYLNYDAAEHRRLQASGDYRCPRGQGPADLRRMEGGFDLAAVPWFMRGPNGIDVGLATDLSQLGWSMRDILVLYHQQFAPDFTDLASSIRRHNRMIREIFDLP